jgi:hypothetical protein
MHLLLNRVDTAAKEVHYQLSLARARHTRLLTLTSGSRKRLNNEQARLIQHWREETSIWEQGLEDIDNILHGQHPDLNELHPGQSFVSDASQFRC